MIGALPKRILFAIYASGMVLGGYQIWLNWLAYQEVIVRPAIEEEDAERKLASSEHITPLYSLDEVFANLSGSAERPHSVGLKLEVELFSEESRSLVEGRAGGIKNAIIETAAEQTYDKLNTVGGKLFFKELLVARINEFFQQAVVRDLHFSSFYLQ